MCSEEKQNQSTTSLKDNNVFVEIFVEKKIKLPDRVEAFISAVKPQCCGPLLKELAAKLPLRNPRSEDGQINDDDSNNNSCPMGHLKRVRRIAVCNPTPSQIPESSQSNSTNNDKNNNSPTNDDTGIKKNNVSPTKSPKKKKQKTSKQKSQVRLEVVLCSVQDFVETEWVSNLMKKYNLKLEKRFLPGRSAESKEELEEWNQIWPTIYFHKKTQEHEQEERDLTLDETEEMKRCMKEAVRDAKDATQQWDELIRKKSPSSSTTTPKATVPPELQGAVISCPETKQIISRASEERKRQQDENPERIFIDQENPLCTPALLAIQGVSRLERKAAMGHGMDSDDFKNGQYLCTGYDLYITKEPEIFEAMALVHSRIRRVVFGIPDKEAGGLGGCGLATAVHSLPGTNHKYRVFYCKDRNVLQ